MLRVNPSSHEARRLIAREWQKGTQKRRMTFARFSMRESYDTGISTGEKRHE